MEFHVTILGPKISRWLIDFWRICVPLKSRNFMVGAHNAYSFTWQVLGYYLGDAVVFGPIILKWILNVLRCLAQCRVQWLAVVNTAVNRWVHKWREISLSTGSHQWLLSWVTLMQSTVLHSHFIEIRLHTLFSRFHLFFHQQFCVHLLYCPESSVARVKKARLCLQIAPTSRCRLLKCYAPDCWLTWFCVWIVWDRSVCHFNLPATSCNAAG
jgi:uncharacterized membrane protein